MLHKTEVRSVQQNRDLSRGLHIFWIFWILGTTVPSLITMGYVC